MKPVLASELNHVEKEIQTKMGVIITATDELKKACGFDSTVGTFEKFIEYFNEEVSPYSLSLYRIGFGVLVMFSLLRFWLKGNIATLYIDPTFHFSYYGFSWVKPLGIYTYLLFAVCPVSYTHLTLPTSDLV